MHWQSAGHAFCPVVLSDAVVFQMSCCNRNCCNRRTRVRRENMTEVVCVWPSLQPWLDSSSFVYTMFCTHWGVVEHAWQLLSASCSQHGNESWIKKWWIKLHSIMILWHNSQVTLHPHLCPCHHLCPLLFQELHLLAPPRFQAWHHLCSSAPHILQVSWTVKVY